MYDKQRNNSLSFLGEGYWSARFLAEGDVK
jgi:hypothetical protein